MESGCLGGEGLGDGKRERPGWLFFLINFIVQLDLLNCLGFHFDKKVKGVNSYAQFQ